MDMNESAPEQEPSMEEILASIRRIISEDGAEEEAAQRARPWYRHKVSPTFADMLACCRLHLWKHWWNNSPEEEKEQRWRWLLGYMATATG